MGRLDHFWIFACGELPVGGQGKAAANALVLIQHNESAQDDD